ncbi:hypothetical protein D9M68_486070 [compost metagenome]
MALRHNRQRAAGPACEFRRPDVLGADYHRRGKVANRGRDADHLVVLDDDFVDFSILANGDATAARSAGETGGNQVGVGEAGLGLVADQCSVAELSNRQQFLCLLPGQQLEGNALVLLLLQGGSQRFKLVAFCGDNHVAALNQAAGSLFIAQVLRKIVEDGPGLASQFDVLLDRIVGTENARGLRGRPGADAAPVENQHVLRTKPGEVECHGTADNTGANYHYVVRIHGCTFH